MRLSLELKNYRCFADTSPARLEIGPGFTALVGPNNSGKSALLRFFYDYRNLWATLSDPNALYNAMRDKWSFELPSTVRDPLELYTHSNDRPQSVTLALSDVHEGDRPPFHLKSITLEIPRASRSVHVAMPRHLASADPNALHIANEMIMANRIPTLDCSCMLRVFRALAGARYFGPGRTLTDTHPDSHFDLEMGNRFVGRWRGAKGGFARSEVQRVRAVTAAVRDVFGYSSLEIDGANDGSTMKVIINGEHFNLPEVGAGLAQFLVILGNLSSVPRPSFVMIDEPEASLHPQLQGQLLKSIAAHTDIGVVFATHSIGLARAYATRVYSLRPQQGAGTILSPLSGTPELSMFLGELQFAQWRELGFEKLLLVEGPSDIPAIQELLRQHGKDATYVVIHLGGDSTINPHCERYLEDLRRIAPEVIALIDSERRAEGEPLKVAREGFREACLKVGVRCHVLERRSIENYWPEAAVSAVKGASVKPLQPFQSLNEAGGPWSKEENWRIAAKTRLQDIAKTDLGVFLDSL